MTIRCSVIVPTYQRPRLLEQCLQSLVNQSLPAEDYEIIVADDAAIETTRLQVEEVSKTSSCRVVYVAVQGCHGPAAARNAACAQAVGDVLAFTDDDCRPWHQWLERGLAAFDSPSVDAAWGQLIMPIPDSPTDYAKDASNLANAVFVTANCFCRRSVFEAVGGFDTRFRCAWREDSDLYLTLLERNCDIVRAPTAKVTHPIRPAPWGISVRQQRKSMFDVLLARKHPSYYRQLIPRFPRLYLVATAALVIALAALVFGNIGLAAIGMTVWFIASSLFCLRRLTGVTHRPGHILEMIITSALIPPLSVYWRLVGLWKFRSISPTELPQPAGQFARIV